VAFLHFRLKQNKSNINDYPEVLATLYNGVHDADLPHASEWFRNRMEKRGFAAFRPNSLAGWWIAHNQTFLATALGIADDPFAEELKPRIVEQFKRIARGDVFLRKPLFQYMRADLCGLV
jgi:hypothetical protein